MKKSSLPENLKNYISNSKVVIFAYSYCPNCQKASALLSNLNIKAEIVYIDRDEKLKFNKQFKEDLDRHSNIDIYPKIYTGLYCLGSYSELYDLFTNGKLFEILKCNAIKFIEDDYY